MFLEKPQLQAHQNKMLLSLTLENLVQKNKQENPMDLFAKILQGITLVPSIVKAVEQLFGNRPGPEKKDAALSFAQAALSLGEEFSAKQITDPDKFKLGLGKVIDGVVDCLNASIWAKGAPPPTIVPNK
jgi:hypothetical protein